MKTLNRAAVVVTPKQVFLDWLRGLDESNRELTMEDLRRDPSIYLFPECSSEHEFLGRLGRLRGNLRAKTGELGSVSRDLANRPRF